MLNNNQQTPDQVYMLGSHAHGSTFLFKERKLWTPQRSMCAHIELEMIFGIDQTTLRIIMQRVATHQEKVLKDKTREYVGKVFGICWDSMSSCWRMQ